MERTAFLRQERHGWFEAAKEQKGSFTLESLLALPGFLLLSILLLGLIQTAQGALSLDWAMQRAMDTGVIQAYPLEQILQLAEGEAPSPGALEAAELTIRHSFAAALGEREGVFASFSAEELMQSIRLTVIQDLQKGSLSLVCTFTPAKLGSCTALLPNSWQLELRRVRRLWLIGRNLLPERGRETSFGGIKKGPLVYITRWGACYHRGECRYLAKSRIPADLNRLSQDYRACSICNPPKRALQNISLR